MTKPTVATPCSAYNEMMENGALPRALMGGTKAMRAAGKKYLPQEPAESETAYANRLSRSTLYNAFAQAVEDLAGKVFAEEIEIEDDVPEQIAEFLENVDNAGRDLQRFARDLFTDALTPGIAHILIDSPPAINAKTRADELAQGIRPYFVHVPMENLIGWKTKVVNGVETLTQIRIKECTVIDDGEWGEVCLEQIRVFKLIPAEGAFRCVWEIYRKPDNKKDEWAKVEEGTTNLDFIPLVTIYTKRTGFMTAKPPLEDLADKNLEHWQSASDQRHILHVARVPILFGAGFSEEEVSSIEIGPNRMVKASSENAKLTYVEHTGAAIEAGRDDLKDIEEQMSRLAKEPLVKKPGTQTATESAIGEAKATSSLQAMAKDLEDCLELALLCMAKYIGLEDGGSLKVNDDFGYEEVNPQMLSEINKARAAGDLSRRSTLKAFVRAGALEEDFNYDTNDAELEEEGPALGEIQSPKPKSQKITKNLDGSYSVTQGE